MGRPTVLFPTLRQQIDSALGVDGRPVLFPGSRSHSRHLSIARSCACLFAYALVVIYNRYFTVYCISHTRRARHETCTVQYLGQLGQTRGECTSFCNPQLRFEASSPTPVTHLASPNPRYFRALATTGTVLRCGWLVAPTVLEPEDQSRRKWLCPNHISGAAQMTRRGS